MHIFSKYAPLDASTSQDPQQPPPSSISTDIFGLGNAFMTDEALDRFAMDTNGLPLPDEAKEELRDSLDVNQDGCLT